MRLLRFAICVSSILFFCYSINAGVLSPAVYPGRSQIPFVSMMNAQKTHYQ
jgi:hypothetical protein